MRFGNVWTQIDADSMPCHHKTSTAHKPPFGGSVVTTAPSLMFIFQEKCPSSHQAKSSTTPGPEGSLGIGKTALFEAVALPIGGGVLVPFNSHRQRVFWHIVGHWCTVCWFLKSFFFMQLHQSLTGIMILCAAEQQSPRTPGGGSPPKDDW